MAAIWPKVEEKKGAEVGKARGMIATYFWCSVFTGSYDSSPNSQAVRDYTQLEKWLDGGPEPDVVKNYLFDVDELLVAGTGRRALYRAVMALTLRRAPRTFTRASRSQPSGSRTARSTLITSSRASG